MKTLLIIASFTLAAFTAGCTAVAPSNSTYIHPCDAKFAGRWKTKGERPVFLEISRRSDQLPQSVHWLGVEFHGIMRMSGLPDVPLNGYCDGNSLFGIPTHRPPGLGASVIKLRKELLRYDKSNDTIINFDREGRPIAVFERVTHSEAR